MLDSFEQPAWIAAILDQIARSNFARIGFIIVNGLAAAPRPEGPRRGLPVRAMRLLRNKKRRSRMLFAAYERWDNHRYHLENDPFAPCDCGPMLRDVDRIVVEPLVKGFTHRFKPEDIHAIRAKNLDVILRFGFNIIRGDILKTALYGVWSYHHGDNDWYRGGPPHFWELVERHPVSGVLLQVLSDELDAGTVLCKANVTTSSTLSVSRNRERPYWTGSLFVIRKLNELHKYGWEYLASHAVPNRPAPGRDRIFRAPTNLQMIRFLGPEILKRSAARVARREEPIPHWKMALRQDPDRFLTAAKPPDLFGFRWIEEPKGHFYADPFLLERDGRTWVFFEDFRYERQKAVIACAEVLPGGAIGPPATILEKPYHLSYPFIVEHGRELFMIPESGENKTVELYRCVSFPYSWQFEKALFSGTAAWDTTLWIEDGQFWFFSSIGDPPGAGLQLYLFHADSLTGEWKSHPANPICEDERMSRSAGALFRDGAALIRPSQDCTVTYGYSFSWNRVTNLNPREYAEEPVLTVLPDWSPGLIGTHTYNRTSRWEVVDGKIRSRLSRHRG